MLRFGYLGVTTTAVLLVVFSSSSAAAVADGVLLYKPEQQGSTPETRRQAQTARMLAVAYDLRYDCAAHNISDEGAVEAFDNTTTLLLGLGIARILTGNRRAGGPEGTWYEDTLTNLLVEYCEEEERGVHHRYEACNKLINLEHRTRTPLSVLSPARIMFDSVSVGWRYATRSPQTGQT